MQMAEVGIVCVGKYTRTKSVSVLRISLRMPVYCDTVYWLNVEAALNVVLLDLDIKVKNTIGDDTLREYYYTKSI